MSEYDLLGEVGKDLLPALLDLYGSTWWAADRQPADVSRMLTGSDVVVAYAHHPTGELAAFCRAPTDGVYLAMVLDVVVAPGHRGQGLGARLMDTVLAHPAVAGARSVELVCQPELFAFYRRWGSPRTSGGRR